MCTSGVNTNQLQTMVTMSEDTLELVQGWLEEIHHLAGHAELSSIRDLAKAMVMVGDVRDLLAGADKELASDHVHDHEFEVELV